VTSAAKLRDVTVKLNGRTVHKGARGTFVLRVPAARLKEGANRIVLTARDASGATSSKSARFRLC
jgi:hypothetical protein